MFDITHFLNDVSPIFSIANWWLQCVSDITQLTVTHINLFLGLIWSQFLYLNTTAIINATDQIFFLRQRVRLYNPSHLKEVLGK